MNKIVVAGLILLSMSGCTVGTGANFLNKNAPNPLIYPLAGSPVRLDSMSGKDVILVFWSTRCSTSVDRLHDFAELLAEEPRYRRAHAVAINIDTADLEPKVREVIASLPQSHLQHSYSGNDAYDESYRAFDVSVVPQFFVLDGEGVVRAEGTSVSDVKRYFRR